MYDIFTANTKTEKRLIKYVKSKKDVRDKFDKLKENPYKANSAHPLHGRLAGKWACWLGSNIRTVYTINEKDKQIVIEAIGSHKISNT